MQRLSFILSAQKDPDLASLRETIGDKEFAALTRNALRAIVRSDYRVGSPLPPGTVLNRPTKEKVRVTISLSAKKDTDVAKLLDYVTNRQVSHFVKEAIRLYVGTILLQAYMNEEFMGVLSNNTHATIHVFQMGTAVTAPVVNKTKKPRKPKKASKRQETSVAISNIVASAPAPMPVATEIPETTIPKFELNNDTIATDSNDDDDVLAMLSAMLS